MYNLLLTILVILSAIIVIAIFMQPTKNQSSNVFDASANDLFERPKARGFEMCIRDSCRTRLGFPSLFFLPMIAGSERQSFGKV